MKIILCPDSMKGSISAGDAAAALAEGIREVIPSAECVCVPIADGGEGTLDALVPKKDQRTARVHGTDGNPVDAAFGIFQTGGRRAAVIEMARAAGLTLVPEGKRNPMTASTFGVGELILCAMDMGCREILLTVGGSGTDDGGCGMFRALGAKLLDKDGNELAGCGGDLSKIAKIDVSALDPRLSACTFTAASDVTNPLTGPRGATAVYAPQKGADEKMLLELEAGMKNYAERLREASGKDVSDIPGCGAGGGLLAPLLAFCHVTVKSGIGSVLDAADFERRCAGAALVVTGEGRIDRQSCYGKAIGGVADRAGKQKIPVCAFAGCLGEGWEETLGMGIEKIYCLGEEIGGEIAPEARMEYSMAHAALLLKRVGNRIAKALTK